MSVKFIEFRLVYRFGGLVEGLQRAIYLVFSLYGKIVETKPANPSRSLSLGNQIDVSIMV